MVLYFSQSHIEAVGLETLKEMYPGIEIVATPYLINQEAEQ